MKINPLVDYFFFVFGLIVDFFTLPFNPGLLVRKAFLPNLQYGKVSFPALQSVPDGTCRDS
jgi:hypothetical protein